MRKHIPNTITCCNLICGCIAVSFAFHHDCWGCFMFIILGAVFDFFDGFTARLLRVSSPIGKELDSLADCITFGFAPATLLFSLLQRVIRQQYPLLPYIAFVLAAFSALRLAKFNLDERQALGFIGLPTPACALFWASSCVWCNDSAAVSQFLAAHSEASAALLIALMLLSCWMLVSEIPMFALKFKHYAWEGNALKYSFVLLSALLLVLLGWGGFAPIVVLYVILSVLTCRKK